jgi:hypothetical protein
VSDREFYPGEAPCKDAGRCVIYLQVYPLDNKVAGINKKLLDKELRICILI